MKLNRSLATSKKIQECKTGNIRGLLEKEFPTAVLQQAPSQKSRNRIFTLNNPFSYQPAEGYIAEYGGLQQSA